LLRPIKVASGVRDLDVGIHHRCRLSQLNGIANVVAGSLTAIETLISGVKEQSNAETPFNM
jgi:hypothetical protein